jgi:outer membrane protein assembly factor BamB
MTRKEIFARCLAACILFPGFNYGASFDWPNWRGPNHDGISRETDWSSTWPPNGPKPLWKASVGTGFSSMAVANERVYTLGNRNDTDTVYCFDAETGREIWKHSYPCLLDAKYYEGGPGSTPTADGARVYTLSKRGHLFCFEAENGNVVWQKNLIDELGVKKPEWGFAGSPLVEKDLLILNVGEAGTAVNKATGKVIWRSGAETAAGYATPIPFNIGDQRCVAIFSSKALVAVRANDGRQVWRYPWETHWDINAADPILVEDKLFLSTFDRGCALLRLNSGSPTLIWSNKEMANHFNGCVFLNGAFFGIHGNTDQSGKDLRCLDSATGAAKWKFPDAGLGSLTAAGDKLIVLSDKGELFVAPASTDAFTPTSRAQVLGGKCWTTPVLSNGRIYCRNARGDLVCLDVRTKAVAGAAR